MPLKRISQLIFVLILLLCAYVLAQLSWQVIALFYPNTTQTFNTISSPKISQTIPSQQDYLQRIRAANLFGTPVDNIKDSPPKAIVKTDNIRETRLNITLLGLIKGDNSVAVVNYQGKQGAYKENEWIADQGRTKVRLISIETDHIIIENNSVPEKLLLPDAKRPQSFSTSSSARSGSASQSIDFGSDNIQNLIGGNIREVMSSDPLSLMKYMSLVPEKSGNAMTGYRINAGQDKRLLQATGIKPGDIITHLDGVPVNTIDISKFYQLLQTANHVALTLRRNGKPVTMDIRL